MDKQIIFDYARHEIDEDVKIFHKVDISKRYIFYNSKRHCVGDCFEEDILKWIEKKDTNMNGASTFSKQDLFMVHLNQIKNDYNTMSANFYLAQKGFDKLSYEHDKIVKENEELRAKLKEMSEQLQSIDSSIDTCSLIDNEHGPDMHCSVCHGEIDDVFRYLMDSHGYKRCPHCGRLIKDIDGGE